MSNPFCERTKCYLALLRRTCWLNLAYSITHYRYVFTYLPPGLTAQRYSSASNDVCRPRQHATRQCASRQRTKCKLWVISYISVRKTPAADTMMILDDSPEGLALQSIAIPFSFVLRKAMHRHSQLSFALVSGP